jgi:hypothetical protein
MFHRFPEELGEPVTLVRSTALGYNESPNISFLVSIVQSGHTHPNPNEAYHTKSLPPIQFEYTAAPSEDQLLKMTAAKLIQRA